VDDEVIGVVVIILTFAIIGCWLTGVIVFAIKNGLRIRAQMKDYARRSTLQEIINSLPQEDRKWVKAQIELAETESENG